MAWLELTNDNGDEIFVNMDQVLSMVRLKDNTLLTTVASVKDAIQIVVKETPHDIANLLTSAKSPTRNELSNFNPL